MHYYLKLITVCCVIVLNKLIAYNIYNTR